MMPFTRNQSAPAAGWLTVDFPFSFTTRAGVVRLWLFGDSMSPIPAVFSNILNRLQGRLPV